MGTLVLPSRYTTLTPVITRLLEATESKQQFLAHACNRQVTVALSAPLRVGHYCQDKVRACQPEKCSMLAALVIFVIDL